MDVNLEILTAATSRNLTTRATVKSEFGITDSANDAVLDRKIAEASADIELALGFAVPSETVRETFRHDHPLRYGYGYGWRWLEGRESDGLFLRRKAVTSIVSVTLDDTLLDPSNYYLNADEGSVHRLDDSGYPCNWWFGKSIIVDYVAGYVLPGNPDANLPAGIEGAAIELVKSFWFNRQRDPAVQQENIPGIRQVNYWVGAVGDPDMLPPEVQRRLALMRRPRMAVA